MRFSDNICGFRKFHPHRKSMIFTAFNLNINLKPTEANCMATGMHSEAKRMQTTHGEARKSKRK